MSDDKNLKNKIGRVGVLMGGESSEREISLKSGQAVYDALRRENADVVAIDLKNTQDKTQLKKDISKEKINVAFIAMHGSFGEDGQLQNFLEELKIPYTGSGPRACELAMDKIACQDFLKKNGIAVPKFFTVIDRNYSFEELNFPLVVKPSNGGSSIGVSIAGNENELKKAVLEAKKYSPGILVEEYIAGEEITVGILGNEALPVIMLKPKEKFYNFQAKYTEGATEYILPAPLDETVNEAAKKRALEVHRCLGLRHFSRVDMILKNGNEPVILEVNAIPGFTPLSLLPKAAKKYGLNFGQLCFRLIEMAEKIG